MTTHRRTAALMAGGLAGATVVVDAQSSAAMGRVFWTLSPDPKVRHRSCRVLVIARGDELRGR